MNSHNTFLTLSNTLKNLRKVLYKHGFEEAITPSARNFQVPIKNRPSVGFSVEKYLRTMIGPALRSNLVFHKKIFEIGPCFRNDPLDYTHSPEFTMLDLYVGEESFEYLLNLALELIKPAIQGDPVWISVADNIRETFGVDLAIQPFEDAVKAIERSHRYSFLCKQSKIIDHYIEQEIESKSLGRTVVLTDYPIGGSEPCAKLKPGTSSIAKRFEIFIDGIEIVHGYEDETDRNLLKSRAIAENLYDADQKIIGEYIDNGDIPIASVGLGIGVERLCMAIDGVKDISSYRFGSCF